MIMLALYAFFIACLLPISITMLLIWLVED
jgi:hypothetical protein